MRNDSPLYTSVKSYLLVFIYFNCKNFIFVNKYFWIFYQQENLFQSHIEKHKIHPCIFRPYPIWYLQIPQCRYILHILMFSSITVWQFSPYLYIHGLPVCLERRPRYPPNVLQTSLSLRFSIVSTSVARKQSWSFDGSLSFSTASAWIATPASEKWISWFCFRYSRARIV